MALRFEWDERKGAINRRRHGVAFEEAETVFADEHALLLDDPDHSAGEDRFILMGIGHSLRVLLVFHCHREGGEVIRIISARKATARERRQYVQRGRR